MARLLKHSRIELYVLYGRLRSSVQSQERNASPFYEAGEYMINGGRSYSSWLGAVRSEGYGYYSYKRSELSIMGDWACLGLTVLAGGLFWNSSRISAEETSILERSEQVVFLYGALRYSLQRKALRLRLRWLRFKLVLREVKLQEFGQENEEYLLVLEDLIEGLEDGLVGPSNGPSKPAHIRSDDPFLQSSHALLWRIEELRSSLDTLEQIDSFLSETGSLKHEVEEHLIRIELLVKRLVEFHLVNEARITQNRELRAKVNALLVNLDKER